VDKDTIWQEFTQQGLDYQERMGFSRAWPEFTRFVEGKQWPASTDKTKYMPRPVINQCDFIVENKKSNILSQTLKMLFSPEEMPEGQDNEESMRVAQDFTDAAATTWADIDQDSLNEEVVDDTLVLGSGIWHYYWDNNKKGGQYTPYVGKVQGEVVDPIDIVLGNPHLPSTQMQRQPWIIVRSFPDTKELKEKAKANGKNPDDIVADSNNTNDAKYDSQTVEMTKPNTTTLLRKYYKENGQIYWMESTKGTVVVDPKPLAPEESKPFEVYPLEMLVFKRRRKCAFGRSVIEDIIPNQKALNWGLGMMLLSIQQTAWPKIIAKLGALQQAITNEPGEIITDHGSMQGLEGVKYMQPPNFSNTPMVITEKIMEMTRQVTGTTEISSGEVIGANMAASAIIALQNQAKKPNEAYEKKLVRSLKNIGRIYEEFYKTYGTMPIPISGQNEDGEEITKTFTGAEHADASFSLKIDVGPASVFSESLQVSVLDKLHDSKELDKYQYIKYLPSNIVPAVLKQDFEKEAQQLKEQQELQASINGQAGKVVAGLSPDEQQMVQEDPTILQDAMATMGGGGSGGM
jgi:hypothetical protein